MEFDKLASKYRGAIATGYEAKRHDGKWDAEQRAAEEILRRASPWSKVLDVPVGTGRLIPILASRALVITGLDASKDMLGEAQESARRSGAEVDFKMGDIRKLPFADSTFELVTCLRFLNWIDMRGVREVLGELSRVSSDRLLIGIRYLTPTSEMNFSPHDLALRAARCFGLPSLRVRRWGMVLHDKLRVETVLKQLQLTIIENRLVERRSDSTDYVFYLLEKRTTSIRLRRKPPDGDNAFLPVPNFAGSSDTGLTVHAL